MICIEDKIVSRDLFCEYFLCHYKKCKGACCIEGESGAPLTKEEVALCQQLLPEVWPLLLPEAQEVIAREGISYIDAAGEEVTNLVGGKNCVFTTYNEEGSCLCAFEKLYREGKIGFLKPISCHLYPIRVHRYPHAIALNYDRWDICRDACINGRRKGVTVYQALREPIERAFGKEFFKQLEACDQLIKKNSL